MPKVSVILPNYNHSKYLEYRIDSILNQTYNDFELIILDDCSTDNSSEIIESYRNCPRISQIIYNQINSGSPFLQWEKGINIASGKYIWIAESDDYSDKDFLKQLIAGLEINPIARIAFCASNIIDEQNVIKSKNYNYGNHVTQLVSQNFLMDGKVFCENYLFYACVLVNASAVVFEKKLFKNVDQDYRNYKVSGDWRIWVEICHQTSILYINNSLNYFRFHANNARTNKSNIMNREAIYNYMASLKKTKSKEVQKRLKDKLFTHWCFEFSRDFRDLNFSHSMNLMFRLIKIDSAFFLKLSNLLIKKISVAKIKESKNGVN